jgi:hypothetical protein
MRVGGGLRGAVLDVVALDAERRSRRKEVVRIRCNRAFE